MAYVFYICNMHCTHLAAFNMTQLSKAKKRQTIQSMHFPDATLLLAVSALNI